MPPASLTSNRTSSDLTPAPASFLPAAQTLRRSTLRASKELSTPHRRALPAPVPFPLRPARHSR